MKTKKKVKPVCPECGSEDVFQVKVTEVLFGWDEEAQDFGGWIDGDWVLNTRMECSDCDKPIDDVKWVTAEEPPAAA